MIYKTLKCSGEVSETAELRSFVIAHIKVLNFASKCYFLHLLQHTVARRVVSVWLKMIRSSPIFLRASCGKLRCLCQCGMTAGSLRPECCDPPDDTTFSEHAVLTALSCPPAQEIPPWLTGPSWAGRVMAVCSVVWTIPSPVCLITCLWLYYSDLLLLRLKRAISMFCFYYPAAPNPRLLWVDRVFRSIPVTKQLFFSTAKISSCRNSAFIGWKIPCLYTKLLSASLKPRKASEVFNN